MRDGDKKFFLVLSFILHVAILDVCKLGVSHKRLRICMVRARAETIANCTVLNHAHILTGEKRILVRVCPG